MGKHTHRTTALYEEEPSDPGSACSLRFESSAHIFREGNSAELEEDACCTEALRMVALRDEIGLDSGY